MDTNLPRCCHRLPAQQQKVRGPLSYHKIVEGVGGEVGHRWWVPSRTSLATLCQFKRFGE